MYCVCVCVCECSCQTDRQAQAQAQAQHSQTRPDQTTDHRPQPDSPAALSARSSSPLARPAWAADEQQRRKNPGALVPRSQPSAPRLPPSYHPPPSDPATGRWVLDQQSRPTQAPSPTLHASLPHASMLPCSMPTHQPTNPPPPHVHHVSMPTLLDVSCALRSRRPTSPQAPPGVLSQPVTERRDPGSSAAPIPAACPPCSSRASSALRSTQYAVLGAGTSRLDCASRFGAPQAQIPLNPRATLFYSPLPAPKLSGFLLFKTFLFLLLSLSFFRVSGGSSIPDQRHLFYFLSEGAAAITNQPRSQHHLSRS